MTSRSDRSLWQVAPCVLLAKPVTTTRCRDNSQLQFALYDTLNFCENRFRCGRILSLRSGTWIQTSLNSYKWLQWQNSPAATMIFTMWRVTATCCLVCLDSLYVCLACSLNGEVLNASQNVILNVNEMVLTNASHTTALISISMSSILSSSESKTISSLNKNT